MRAKLAALGGSPAPAAAPVSPWRKNPPTREEALSRDNYGWWCRGGVYGSLTVLFDPASSEEGKIFFEEWPLEELHKIGGEWAPCLPPKE